MITKEPSAFSQQQIGSRTAASACSPTGSGVNEKSEGNLLSVMHLLDFGRIEQDYSSRGNVLIRNVLVLLLAGVAFGQVHPVERYIVEQHLDDLSRVKCGPRLPEDFSCAVFFAVDPPLHYGIDIASVVGGQQNTGQTYGFIRSVSVLLEDTLYTAIYTPPLKRDGKLSPVTRCVGIPVRIDGDGLIVIWPDGTKAKAKIVRREKIHPRQPQPA
ncbi:MAG: hypothetical protein ACM34G_16545 [Acidobacteriota bacterium]